MEQVAKQFTVIDFLGILMPGAIVALAVNTCLVDLTLPAKNFFGDNAWILLAYFIMLSYLCGHALNQLAVFLERIWKVPDMHAKYCEDEAMQKAYCKVFHMNAFPSGAIDRIKAGQEIFHYVQKEQRPQRILLFTAFYTMSRALVAAFILILTVGLPYTWTQMRDSVWMLIILCVVSVALFRFRWVYYERKCVEEAYMLFLTDTHE